MRIVCVGGGPGSLYFSLLARKAFPDAQVEVYERNAADDTFGWGVVFSDETLQNLAVADPESHAAIVSRFAYWSDIDTFHRGERVRSTGHEFCGLARRSLLDVLQRRCRDLGVRLTFRREIGEPDRFLDADLLVAGDGIQSGVRTRWQDRFRPSISWGATRFCWLGTTLPLEAFTFVFKEAPDGLFIVHAYPFEEGRGTWIVECHEDTWRRAGLDSADEAATVAYLEDVFAEELRGHRLLTNRSIWRRFPTVTNARWHFDRVVLIGDAAHSAHFSIGSGTKLALEDAIALADAFRARGTDDVPGALAAYEEARRLPCAKIQRAAATSESWFENARRYLDQPPVQFTFNLMTRSKRITYDNLARRDPALVDRVSEWFAGEAGAPSGPDGRPPPPVFTPFRVRSMALRNRIVCSPMCQYSATGGTPNDWHLVHLGSRAVGGAGLVFTEMTDVSPEGRITHGCAGMYADEHVAAWRRIVEFVHANSEARIGIQLAHAGRKGSCRLPWEGDDPLQDASAWTVLGPSPIPYDAGWPAPREMDRRDLRAVVEQFRRAVERAQAAGFDAVELHMAHGYLLSSFISPLSNRRHDEYGGSIENRMRFPLEVLRAAREAWPPEKPIFVRITASDWMEDRTGVTEEDSVETARLLYENGCDVVDVSTGGNSPLSKPEYGRMYQVPFADRIRHALGRPVMAVGGIRDVDHANTVVAAGRADLCAMARAHLLDPYLALRASIAYGYADHPWPRQYLPARPMSLPPPRGGAPSGSTGPGD